MNSKTDIDIVRELAKAYFAISNSDQEAKREAWRKLHNLEPCPPPVLARAFAWHEMPDSKCICKDADFRAAENHFRMMLFAHTFEDDRIFEPWYAVRAVHIMPSNGPWGLEIKRHHSGEKGGSFVWDAPIKSHADVDRVAEIQHRIDEDATAARLEKVQNAIGDILPVVLDRSPAYQVWRADISTDVAHLRGLEQIMIDMIDAPELMHDLLAKMRDGILRVHQQAEDAGDWTLMNHENQAMSYSRELADPSCDSEPVSRKKLWNHTSAQEYTGVGPRMHDEFLLQYQLPIMEKFGLVAYGCCEDLSHKIDMLRQIPNLRRIAVSPMADVATCAEQIGTDYAMSYRPSPADMVAYGFDENRIRAIVARDLEICRGQHLDITLKDVQTVEADTGRVRKWVALMRRIIDEVF